MAEAEWPVLGPVAAEFLDSAVAARLRASILDGTLPDGYHLREIPLAQSMGVSRGPVRDAFKRLAEEGLVELVPRRGAYVRWIPVEDLLEVVMIRESIEGVALKLAMSRANEQLGKTLDLAVKQMQEATLRGDWEATLRAEISFHEGIYVVSGSRRLFQLWQHMRPTVMASFRNDRVYYESRAEVPERHQRLLDVIVTGNDEAVASELRRHIRPTKRLGEADEGRAG